MVKARVVQDDRARVTKQKPGRRTGKPKSGLLDVSIPHSATHLLQL
jgi:hypothetical protein